VIILEAARDLAKRCGPVLPVNGKIPLWEGWPERASRSVGNEREWTEATGVGLTTGRAAGYFVLDVDAKGGIPALKELQNANGNLPITWRQYTGGGGMQDFFRTPSFPVRNSVGKIAKGIDVRGERGFVVAPPSLHPSGNQYRWADKLSPWETKLAYAPNWLIDKLRAQPRPAIVELTANIANLPDPVEAVRRARAYLAKIPGAVSGERGHNETWKAACRVVRGFALGEQRGFELLASDYNPRCSPPWSEAELWHKVRGAARNGTDHWGSLLLKPLRDPWVTVHVKSSNVTTLSTNTARSVPK
jgi:hypothetical protein